MYNHTHKPYISEQLNCLMHISRPLLLVMLCSLWFINTPRVMAQGLKSMPKKDSLSVATNPTWARSINLALPLAGGSLLAYTVDENIKQVRMTNTPNFHFRLDDYTTLIPLGMQLGVSAYDYGGVFNKEFGAVVFKDALAYGIMGLSVTAIKHAVGRLRPDGSEYVSFPSGHTATAFTSAVLFDLEHGHKYPALTAVGYGMATYTGISRILNNRHWLSDVLAGAAIGVISAELAHYLHQRFFVQEHQSKPKAVVFRTEEKAFKLNGNLRVENLFYIDKNRTIANTTNTLSRQNSTNSTIELIYTCESHIEIGTFFSVGIDKIKLHTKQINSELSAHLCTLGSQIGYNIKLWNGGYMTPKIALGGIFSSNFEINSKNTQDFTPTIKRKTAFSISPKLQYTQQLNDRIAINISTSYLYSKPKYRQLQAKALLELPYNIPALEAFSLGCGISISIR